MSMKRIMLLALLALALPTAALANTINFNTGTYISAEPPLSLFPPPHFSVFVFGTNGEISLDTNNLTPGCGQPEGAVRSAAAA